MSAQQLCVMMLHKPPGPLALFFPRIVLHPSLLSPLPLSGKNLSNRLTLPRCGSTTFLFCIAHPFSSFSLTHAPTTHPVPLCACSPTPLIPPPTAAFMPLSPPSDSMQGTRSPSCYCFALRRTAYTRPSPLVQLAPLSLPLRPVSSPPQGSRQAAARWGRIAEQGQPPACAWGACAHVARIPGLAQRLRASQPPCMLAAN